MPMCDCGVPDKHTTAVSSSKIGARNVAPASATHATTPSADVSINASTSSGDFSARHAPRTAAASNTFVPTAMSFIGPHCNHGTYDAAVPPDDLDAEAWLLLHEIRLRGVYEIETGTVVTTLTEAGLVVHANRGFRVTPEGRTAHAAWARVDPGGEIASAVERAYRRFLVLNPELLRVCTEWQIRPGGSPNDHKDPAYDWAIFDRLSSIDDRAGPLVSGVARVIDRFGTYRSRLRAARRQVEEGEHAWLTSPRIDSYHTVWMQLHEDLLLALGKERSSEGSEA
jgi:hypothetical protein